MTLHEAVVCNLVKKLNLQTTGFVKSLEKSAGDVHTPLFKWVNVRPDAFTIGMGLVVVYEVEDTHPVKGERLRTYVRLWQQLDEMGWELRVYAVHVYGHTTEIPLHQLILNT